MQTAFKLVAQDRSLDLLFIHDATGSQQPYIKATTRNCEEICEALRTAEEIAESEGSLRIGLVTFRDFDCPNDYIARIEQNFTPNIQQVTQKLRKIQTGGGDDIPEAVASALYVALNLDWRDDAAKVAVLITDAPPHDIGEDGDKYLKKEKHDPLHLAWEMGRKGIALLVIACEPSLSNDNKFAHDFYKALASITGGLMLPLTAPNLITPLVVGFALEQVGLDSMVREALSLYKQTNDAQASWNKTVDNCKDKQITSVKMANVYTEPPWAEGNVNAWLKRDKLEDALPNIVSKKQERVPPQFIPPSGGWPKYPIGITLRNIDQPGIIQIIWMNLDGTATKDKTLEKNMMYEEEFIANEIYTFRMRSGREQKVISRAFAHRQDWNLADHFV